MSSRETVLNREDLYAQVWSTPMRRLAEKYGISDVGLAKICKKHHIPRPPVGYWAKKEFGKAVEQPPLPVTTDADLLNVYIRESRRRDDGNGTIPSRSCGSFGMRMRCSMPARTRRRYCKPWKISQSTLDRSRSQYDGMKAEEAKRLKELEIENRRLKQLVAEKELDIQMLKHVAEGNW